MFAKATFVSEMKSLARINCASPALFLLCGVIVLLVSSGCAEPKALSTIGRDAAHVSWDGTVQAPHTPFVTTVTGQRALEVAQGGGLVGYVVGKTTASRSARSATEQFSALRDQTGHPETKILADATRNELELAGFHAAAASRSNVFLLELSDFGLIE